MSERSGGWQGANRHRMSMFSGVGRTHTTAQRPGMRIVEACLPRARAVTRAPALARLRRDRRRQRRTEDRS